MWNRFRAAIIFFTTVVGGVLVWLSRNSIPNKLQEADGYLGTNLKWLGWSSPPATLASSAADQQGRILAFSLFFIAAIALLSWAIEKLLGSAPNFEKVETWSVSMRFGGWSTGALSTTERYFTLSSELINLSASQARVLELMVTLRQEADPSKTIMLNSENTGRRPFYDMLVQQGALQAQLDELIRTPVNLLPNAALKGTVEFRIHNHHQPFFADGTVHVTEVTVRDRRSQKSETVRMDQSFDAKKQKSYRGEIGIPYDSLAFRWREFKRRRKNKGKGITIHTFSKWS